MMGFFGFAPPQEVMPKAKAMAVRALELDETSGAAHSALGMVRILYEWDWKGAEPEFQRALELNPGDAAIRLAYAMTLLAPAGRLEEAIEQMRKARDLDPLSLVINTGMWLERYVIIVASLHRDYLPSSWGMYTGTAWDWSMYLGSIGLFFALLFLFIRFLPVISIFEMRTLLPEAHVQSFVEQAGTHPQEREAHA